jgi:hypothetical protein
MQPSSKVGPHDASVTFWREATWKQLSISKKQMAAPSFRMSLAENFVRPKTDLVGKQTAGVNILFVLLLTISFHPNCRHADGTDSSKCTKGRLFLTGSSTRLWLFKSPESSRVGSIPIKPEVCLCKYDSKSDSTQFDGARLSVCPPSKNSLRNRPWRPIRLWDVKDLTLSKQSAYRWR